MSDVVYKRLLLNMTKVSASVAHCLDVEQIFHTLGPWLRPGLRSTPVVLETLLDTVLTQSWFQTLTDLLMKVGKLRISNPYYYDFICILYHHMHFVTVKPSLHK